MSMRELSGRELRKRRRKEARKTGVVGLVHSWAEMHSAKFQLAKNAYEKSRENIDLTTDRDTIPMSEDARHAADLPDLMARSDYQFRNNAIYSGIGTRFVDNLVGPEGAKVVMGSKDSEYNRAVEQAWLAFYHDDQFTLNGLNGPQSQHVTMLDCYRGGNCLWYETAAGWQMFEPHQLGTPWGYNTDLRKIAGGIEKGPDGRPARYWVGPFSAWGYVDGNRAVGLRADLCYLVGLREYSSTFRSVPPLSSALQLFVDMNKYLESELYAKRMSAAVVGIVKSNDAKAFKSFQTAAPKGGGSSASNVPGIEKRVNLSPGSIIPLLENEDFRFEGGQDRPGAQFEGYIRLMSRFGGSKVGMPLELSFLDFSETNFSSSKMLMQQAFVTMGKYQVNQLGPLVKRQFISFLDSGLCPVPKKSVVDPRRFKLQYHTPPWVDFYKEAAGRTLLTESGALDLKHLADEMGRDLEDIVNGHVTLFKLADVAATANGFAKGSPEYDEVKAYILGNPGKYRDALMKAGMLGAGE